jgi:phosphoglucosamine mutase
MTRHRLFGTDGIRAPFGEFPLDQATVTRLGTALGEHLRAAHPRPEHPREAAAAPVVVLGGDTRFSTPDLASWLAAGLQQGGARVRSLGIVPTPAVAWATRACGAETPAS